MKQVLFGRFTIISTLCIVTGCSIPKDTKITPDLLVGTKSTQRAPETVYSRVKWTLIPYPMPQQNYHAPRAPLIQPSFAFELSEGKLSEAATMLAAAARYSSYCASTIADYEISLAKVGTVDELAEAIADLAHIRVVVDHNNREIRFLAAETES